MLQNVTYYDIITILPAAPILKGAVKMSIPHDEISQETADAAELFAQLPTESEYSLIALIKSLLSEQ